MLSIVGRTLLVERGVAVIAITIVAAATVTAMVEGGGINKELTDIANVRQERDKRDQNNAKRRGEDNPRTRHAKILIAGARRGEDDAGIQNIFIVKNILS